MVDWSNHALEQSSSRRPAFTQPAVHVAYAMRDAFMQAFRPRAAAATVAQPCWTSTTRLT